MIQQLTHQQATEMAREDARFFTEGLMSSTEFFNQDHSDYLDKALNGLKLLLKDNPETNSVDIHELDDTPEPNYASWLVKTQDGRGGIALFANQMVNWQQKKGMPLRIQKIRSVIHEMGHLKLSPRLLTDTPSPSRLTRIKLAPAATPEEEEVAWVYAITFLALLLGDYSLEARSRRNCDDAPRLFL